MCTIMTCSKSGSNSSLNKKPHNIGIFATCSTYRSPYELPTRVLPPRFFPLPISPPKVFSSHECHPSFTFRSPPNVSPLHNFNFQPRPCQREQRHGNLFHLRRVNNIIRRETRNSDVVAHHLALFLLPRDLTCRAQLVGFSRSLSKTV